MNLTKFSLKRPVTTLLVLLALAVFGISSLLGLRLELMPDMDMPVMMVMTIYPGADPESVEELVSSEIEGKVGALSGVDSVTTYSQENSSMVLLQYDYSVDTNDAYLDLRAALRKLYVEDMPLVVIIDSEGKNLYDEGKAAYLASKKN